MLPLLFALLLSLTAAHAAEVPAPDTVRAEALFNQALGMPGGKESAPLLQEAVRLSPGDARYRVALGDASLLFNQMRDTYTRAIQADPISPLPHLRLAEMDWANDKASAAAHLKKAIALDPENALPLYERALLHFESGEDAQGRQCLEKARACKSLRSPQLLMTAATDPNSAIAYIAVQAQRQDFYFHHFRDLTRQIVRVAADLQKQQEGGTADARALLLEGERLAYRILTAEPRALISLLYGRACDALIARALEPLLRQTNDVQGVARLQARNAADKALVKQIGAAVNEEVAAGWYAPGPDGKVWPWRGEGAFLTRLLEESGIRETIDADAP